MCSDENVQNSSHADDIETVDFPFVTSDNNTYLNKYI